MVHRTSRYGQMPSLGCIETAPDGCFTPIYAATPDGVYNYDPVSHKLTLHTSGNKLSESKLAFEIGIATDPRFSRGWVQFTLGYLAIVPFLENTSEKPSAALKTVDTKSNDGIYRQMYIW